MYKDILDTLKIKHYLKNLIIFIPLILSSYCKDFSAFIISFIMFISFCFVSSSVYIFNDLTDIMNDKKHPVKCKRPIADKKISVKSALILFFIFLSASIFISFFINRQCTVIIICYLILNILYSLSLKNIAFIDIICIAIGFMLRILSGYFAINEKLSIFVVLTVFFTSLFFTSIKRKTELKLLKKNILCRMSIQKLTYNEIEKFTFINLLLSIIFYCIFIIKTGNIYVYISIIPFSLTILRLMNLSNKEIKNDDPLFFIINDKLIKCLHLIFLIILALYICDK